MKKSAEKYRVECRKHAFSALKHAIGGRRALLFTDSNVLALYGRAIHRALPGVPVYAMEAGEEHKTPQTLFALLQEMAGAGLNRASVLAVLGGGVVGDVGGLAASLYMRGIPCIQVPTTLLAQVDSAVGGKTAVDFCGVKNLVGAFWRPEKVIADPAFFATLPPRELRCGLGEIVKHGALDAALFARLTAQDDLFDLAFLAEIVPQNIAFKASVVAQDPFEKGLRKCLNLGHTTAHAFELSSGLSHGECVLWGILFESAFARSLPGADGEFLDRLEALARRALGGGEVPGVSGLRAALLDKKNTKADEVTLTLPLAPGKYALSQLPFAEYEAGLRAARERLC